MTKIASLSYVRAHLPEMVALLVKNKRAGHYHSEWRSFSCPLIP